MTKRHVSFHHVSMLYIFFTIKYTDQNIEFSILTLILAFHFHPDSDEPDDPREPDEDSVPKVIKGEEKLQLIMQQYQTHRKSICISLFVPDSHSKATFGANTHPIYLMR